jgi:hypothetical protein
MNVLEFEFRYLYNIMQYMILSVISVNQVRLFLVAPFQVPVSGRGLCTCRHSDAQVNRGEVHVFRDLENVPDS